MHEWHVPLVARVAWQWQESGGWSAAAVSGGLPIRLSTHPSMHSLTHLTIHPSIHPTHPSDHLNIPRPAHHLPPLHPHTDPCICLSIHPMVSPSIPTPPMYPAPTPAPHTFHPLSLAPHIKMLTLPNSYDPSHPGCRLQGSIPMVALAIPMAHRGKFGGHGTTSMFSPEQLSGVRPRQL